MKEPKKICNNGKSVEKKLFAELLGRVKLICHYKKKLDATMEDAIMLGIINPDGILKKRQDDLIRVLINSIDNDGWINWFIFENRYGEAGLSAKGALEKKARPVKTVERLCKLMIQGKISKMKTCKHL